MSVYLYQRTRRHIPEDSSFRGNRRENWDLIPTVYENTSKRRLWQGYAASGWAARMYLKHFFLVRQRHSTTQTAIKFPWFTMHGMNYKKVSMYRDKYSLAENLKYSGHRLWRFCGACYESGWLWWNKGQRAWIPWQPRTICHIVLEWGQFPKRGTK